MASAFSKFRSPGWRRAATAAGAALLALAVNGFIFFSLPLMVSSRVAEKTTLSADSVDFIRVSRPPSPVRKEKPPPERTHKSVEEKTKVRSLTKTARPRPKPGTLSFELNPRLPMGPIAVSAPGISVGRPEFDLRDTFDAGELDQPLTPLSRAPPAMPLRARSRGLEGHVRFSFIVNPEGRVEDVQILEEDPPDVFTAAVLRAVSSWRFKPPTVDGVPVKTKVVQNIVFKLD